MLHSYCYLLVQLLKSQVLEKHPGFEQPAGYPEIYQKRSKIPPRPTNKHLLSIGEINALFLATHHT